MKTLYSIIVTALFLAGIHAYAAPGDPVDFQMRIPLHIQGTGFYTNSHVKLGIAAWTIFSDVTERDNKTASFHVLGPLVEYGKKGSWLEVMGGFKRNEDGYNDPAVDIRLLDRTIPRVNLLAEVAYFPREERRRLYTWVAMDTPIPFWKYQPRIGFESENIISYSGGEDILGIGPRLVLPIPLPGFSSNLSSSLTTTYQFREGMDVVRCYLGFTYKFGR